MRLHCTKKMLDIIKKTNMIDQNDSLDLDETFSLSPDMDELYDWHANIIELSKAKCLVVLVNDLTNFPVVVGPITYKNFSRFIPAIKTGLKELMMTDDFPEEVIDSYLKQVDLLLITKSLGRKKIGPMNAITKDVEYALVYDSIKIADINSFTLSKWVGESLRAKDKNYYVPREKWLKEWESRTGYPLFEQYKQDKAMKSRSMHESNTETMNNVINETQDKRTKGSEDITDKEWLKLYKAAEAFQKSEPWDHLGDTDLVIVQHPDTAERAYCSVMGAMGEHYAMAVYIGEKGFLNFHQLASGERHLPDHQLLHAQNCLMVSYEDITELDPFNYDHMQSLGLDYKGSKRWPEIKKFEPGYHPWLELTKTEIQWLTLALEQVPGAVHDLKKGKIKEKGFIGLYPGRLKEPNKEWETVHIRLPEMDKMKKDQRKIIIEDELIVRRLKNIPEIKDVIQLDVLYAPVPIQESEDQRPLYPRLLLSADAATGEVLSQDMYERKEEDPESVLGMLQEICQTSKPKKIEVRQDSIEWIIEDFCHKVGIELIIKETLSAIDIVMYELMRMDDAF